MQHYYSVKSISIQFWICIYVWAWEIDDFHSPIFYHSYSRNSIRSVQICASCIEPEPNLFFLFISVVFFNWFEWWKWACYRSKANCFDHHRLTVQRIMFSCINNISLNYFKIHVSCLWNWLCVKPFSRMMINYQRKNLSNFM